MQKVAILAHRSLRDQLLDTLQQKGVIEVTETKTQSVLDHIDVNFKIAELQFAIATLKDVADKKTLDAALRPSHPDAIIKASRSTDVRGIVDRLHAVLEQETTMTRALEEIAARRSILAPWAALPMRLDADAHTTHTEVCLGVIAENALPSLQKLASDPTQYMHLETFPPTGGAVPCLAIVLADARKIFEEQATALGWTAVQLPQLPGTTADMLADDHQEERRLISTLEAHRRERAALSVQLPGLIQVQTFLRWLTDKQAVREALVESFATVTLLGWVPKAQVVELEQSLGKMSSAVAVLKVKPDAGEEPPVYLKNSVLVTPFESVTMLYGLPLPSEMDPTAPLAPFFALYFALCLTDGGYGLALVVIFGAWLMWKRPSVKDATLFWLLFISGIISVLVGIPFGGWFGLTPEQAPAFLTVTHTDGTMWFVGQMWNLSTQEGINFLQYLSLALGILHMFYGIYLAGWFKWVHGAKAEAFWQHFTSHLLLGAALFVAFAPADRKAAALWTLYAALALTVWGKSYGTVWYLRPIMGLLGFLNFAIGMLSNSLSYLRILALGLVTGAIALAVNQVAIEMSKLFPLWLAIPVMILIALVGHTISIALNTLGAFIHSGRLQFIEFFGQFFEGGGKPFTPFRRSLS